jgi:MYXO-CTERM domain-containing protein
MWLLPLALSTASAAPFFVQDPSALPSPQPCANPDDPSAEGCSTNQAQLADLDGDGDLDILFANGGTEYASGEPQPLVIYTNTAGAFSYASDDALGGFSGRVRQVAIGDIDGDGDLDLVAPDGYGLQADAVFVQDHGLYTEDGAARLGTTSHAGATRLADVDDDGDLDLYISDWGDTPPGSTGVGRLYINGGTGFFEELVGAIPADLSIQGTGPGDVEFFDADADADLDLLIANRAGDSLLLVNDGVGVYSDFGRQIPAQGGLEVTGPGACDVDGDGDLDLWLDDGSRDGLEQLLINDGHGTFSDQTNAKVDGNPVTEDSVVTCADVDQDGDMDAVIASPTDVDRVLENDGDGNFLLVEAAFTDASGAALVDETQAMAIGDLDGDGVLDVVTGQSGVDSLNAVYFGVGPVDAVGPTIRHADSYTNQLDESSVIFHFTVQDGATSDAGPQLQRAYVEFDGNAIDAMWMGGDLYRAELELANGPHALQACVIDVAGNETCTFEEDFTVGSGKDGCGCATTRGQAGALGLLALAFVGVTRRRAPRSHA